MGNYQTVGDLEHTVELFYGFGFVSSFLSIFIAIEGLLWIEGFLLTPCQRVPPFCSFEKWMLRIRYEFTRNGKPDIWL